MSIWRKPWEWTRGTVCRVILDVLVELALALAVPAYVTLVAVVVLAFQRSGSRRCPPRRAGAR